MASMSCVSLTWNIVALVCMLSMSILGLQVRAANCNFAASCASESLSGATLSASCAAINGNSVPTWLNLNAKISNSNGRLICPGANFGASCSNIGLSGSHTLVANCKNTKGVLIQTSLDLNHCIRNSNGHLQFCV